MSERPVRHFMPAAATQQPAPFDPYRWESVDLLAYKQDPAAPFLFGNVRARDVHP